MSINLSGMSSTFFKIAFLMLTLGGIAFSQSAAPEKDYLFLETIQNTIARDSSFEKLAAASLHLSMIGEHNTSLEVMGRILPHTRQSHQSDSVFLSSLCWIDAKDYIVSIADSFRVIMLNEAHHVAQHQVFTASLLAELYKKGFRYFGAETINADDFDLNKRGYPVFNSGWYTAEPQYGELVRDALRIGYTVFAYEDTTNGGTGERERQQAINIHSVLKKDQQAKVIIHAGYDHIREDSVGSYIYKETGGLLKEMSGLDPLTINQVRMSEQALPEKEDAYYRFFLGSRPTVFVDKNGEVFSAQFKGSKDRQFDIQVFHPRTAYRSGRPEWLYREGERQDFFLSLDKIRLSFPVLVKAYHTGEDIKQAVPADVIELKTEDTMKALVLYPGKYKILLENMSGEKEMRVIEVK